MNNNWSIEQTKELFNAVHKSAAEGKGLSHAFSQIAKAHSRSVNSVRNFYYSQCKMFSMVPRMANELGIKLVESKRDSFETFSTDDMKSLVTEVLTKRVSGKSVRAILSEYSKNNPVLALRYMNKYRSMLATHKSMVLEVMRTLREKGEPYFNPYTNSVITAAQSDSRRRLADYLSKLEEAELDKFIDIINKLVASE